MFSLFSVYKFLIQAQEETLMDDWASFSTWRDGEE